MALIRAQAWRDALEGKLSEVYRDRLGAAVLREYEAGPDAVCPQKKEDVFACLNKTALEDVKIVIVGQDPYHGPGQADGLAFSYAADADGRLPPTSRNIMSELERNYPGAAPSEKDDGDLSSWAQQGVLLLNVSLTVRAGKAGSHLQLGWGRLTEAIIKLVDAGDKGVVFLLWGDKAHKLAGLINEAKHKVIKTSHPSPLGYTKTAAPFARSGCFKAANDFLEEISRGPVDWDL
mmetsp:Transcript_13218/g.38369  ORF Transcript_13218/g.38369 Transcript_13218/m.38369 type:complete len:234 (+) Transcript_13218:3163-3864(+)